MASDAKYNIDVFNIRPAGKPTKGLWANGRQSYYAWKGSTCIYDKVYYELSMDDVGADERVTGPEGFTLYASDYASVNRKTHGNGSVEYGLDLNSGSVSFGPNTSTASTQTQYVTVTQWDGPLSSWVGASVTWTVTQAKDYPVSISLSLGSPGDIPASGGSISSTSWSSTVTFKSGNVVRNSNLGEVTWGSAVSASSLGTTATTRTQRGTLTASISYTCNGHTVTDSSSVPVYQEQNRVERTTYGALSVTGVAYEDTDYESKTLSPSRNGSASQSQSDTYTSTAVHTYTIYPSCSWSVSSNASWASIVSPSSNSTNVSVGENEDKDDRSVTITTCATASTNNSSDCDTTSFVQEGVPRVVTGITFEILTPIPHLKAIGGKVTFPDDFNYRTRAFYDDGYVETVTYDCVYRATSPGSDTVERASGATPSNCTGTIDITAKYTTSYGSFEDSDSVCIEKKDRELTGKTLTSITVTPIMYSSCGYPESTISPFRDAYVTAYYRGDYDNGTTGTVTETITTGADYTISSDDSWVTINSPSSRSTTATVKENTGNSSRMGTVKTSASYTYSGVTKTDSDSTTFSQGYNRVVTSISLTMGAPADIPRGGGTRYSGDCSYTVTATYNDNGTDTVPNSQCTFNISPASVSASTNSTENRVKAGTFSGTASFAGKTSNQASCDVYQEAGLKTPKILSITYEVT